MLCIYDTRNDYIHPERVKGKEKTEKKRIEFIHKWATDWNCFVFFFFGFRQFIIFIGSCVKVRRLFERIPFFLFLFGCWNETEIKTVFCEKFHICKCHPQNPTTYIYGFPHSTLNINDERITTNNKQHLCVENVMLKSKRRDNNGIE